jgi:hypothetical protein
MNNIISQKEKNTIDALCNKYEIKNYTINGDGSIDVDGDVNLESFNLKSIPVKFNTVGGYFMCGHNQLTSLVGCPNTVGGYFMCNNNQLTSLLGCPNEVDDYVNCNFNPFTTLEFCPTVVGGRFFCGTTQLPNEYINLFNYSAKVLTLVEQPIFLKYQSYYDVWTPEFNLEGMNELVAEIKDGLK